MGFARPPPDGDGPWDPPHEWYCDGRDGGGGWDYCVEGSSCPSPVSGNCSGTINRCVERQCQPACPDNHLGRTDLTTYQLDLPGHCRRQFNDNCEVIITHPVPVTQLIRPRKRDSAGPISATARQATTSSPPTNPGSAAGSAAGRTTIVASPPPL